MERSRSLSQDQEGATDGGIDIKGKPSGNQAHSTNSSSHLVNKVTSSLHTASLHWETSPAIGSYFHDENGNVKSDFSNTGPDRPTEAFRDFSQPYFPWISKQAGGSKSSSYTDVSSFVYRATDDQTYTYTLETSLAPTAGHPQLIPTSSIIYNQQSLSSSSATSKLTPAGDNTASVTESGVYYAATVCTHPSACSSHVASLEPSHSLLVDPFEKIQVPADKSTFDLNTVRTIAETSSVSDLKEVHTELFITLSDTDANSEASTRTTLNINKSQKQTLNTSLPTVDSKDASAHPASIVQSLNKLKAEFWHADRERLTSNQIYTRSGPLFDGILESGAIGASLHTFQDLSVVPTGAIVTTEESNLPTVSVITKQSTPDKSFNDIAWIPSVFGAFGGVNTSITRGIKHNHTPEDTLGSYSGLLRESVAVAYFPPSRSFLNPILNVASSSILGDSDTWLHSSQLLNIRNIAAPLSSITIKHLVSAARDSYSSDSILKVGPRRNLSLSLEDTDLFPSEDLTFPIAYIDTYSQTHSVQLFTTLPEDDSQDVNRLERKAEATSSAISCARPAYCDCLSGDESLHPTSRAYIFPSHATVNYRLSAETFPILRNNMEISTVSSIYLQPSSTLSYDSAFSDVSSHGNWNVNKWPAVFNDALAETTSYQPLSLQSTTVSQAMAQDDASRPTLVQSTRSVPASSSMFTTLENVTGVPPATGRTTHKMNISDGETSSRQVPNFNTTMIIASAGAVFALVIFVIITICCLRRKRRSKNSSSRQEGDDLWVDLYRSNSSHQMPLPSLTTCPSSFEMTDTLKSAGSTEFVTDSKHTDVHTPEAGSSVVNQMKAQRQISSFQIKNPKLETEQELEQAHSVSELGFFEDHADSWGRMATSLSMTSLPTTEVSYHTNVTDYNLAVVGQKFRAVYNYKPVCKGEMALKEGELVECKERDRNGWMLGYKPRTNEEGWFPAVYVDELSSDDDLDFTCEIPETYDILESNKLNSTDQYWTGIEHRVCYDYRSSVPGDLDLETGQIVIVLQTLANGWWFAVSGNKCGWFPGSYVEIDSSTEEPPSNGDFYQVNDHTSVSTEMQDAIAVQASEDKSDTANVSLASISELPEEKENVDEDQTKSARTDVADETSKLNDSTSTAIQVGDKHGLKESACAADTSEVKSTVVLTLNEQTLKKSDTHSAESVSINSATYVGTDKSSHSQKRPEHSLRPARPAPPPPKHNDSKVKKDGKTSADNNSKMETSKTPDSVLKKPVMLIHGKKPKMQKILRSHLDEKQLNPMIRPSTRGFIPKPTAYKHNGFRHEYSSTTGEHAHSSHSITHDLHSERPMLSQPHSSVRRLSPFQPLSLQPLSQHEHTSSQTSLGSCPETRLVYPRGSTPHNEQDKVNHSNINYFPQERSLTPDYRRERSLTPDYKRDRSNSPVLLTTGNLLLNVQRFHGALKHPTPLGNEKGSLKGSSAEKRDREFALANTSPNTLSTFSRQLRAAPTTAANLKTSPLKRIHNKQTFGVLRDQNSESNSMNAAYNQEPLNKHPNSENTLPTNTIYTDSTKETMSHRKEHPSKYPNSDNTSLNQESFIVMPGTVSEIVQQINKHSPLQTELLQKLTCDKRQSESSDIPVRQNILIETHAHKLLPTDQSQDAMPNNSFKDVTSNNDSITAL